MIDFAQGHALEVGYYGEQIAKFAYEHPKAPIMLHFGKSPRDN